MHWPKARFFRVKKVGWTFTIHMDPDRNPVFALIHWAGVWILDIAGHKFGNARFHQCLKLNKK